MIRVLVLGQPFWASRIAAALDLPGGDMRASFIAQGSYPSLIARPARAEAVVIIRAGYRIGATTARGRLFDAYWSILRRSLPRAAICHYWLGTDVADTLAEARAGTLRPNAVAGTRSDLHLADAPWLAAELAEVGVDAIVAHVPQPYRSPAEPPPLPAEFRVLTYLPGNRLDFYGGQEILEAARRLPDVAFDIVGAFGSAPRPSLPNVTWHGWVDDMSGRYEGATVVVRIPRHDGLGATVVEGLLYARHVIYTHEVPFVRAIWPVTADALVAGLGELHAAHRSGQLALNLAGRTYAREAYDQARLVDRLRTLLRERA